MSEITFLPDLNKQVFIVKILYFSTMKVLQFPLARITIGFVLGS
jgi:hypothetical protein